MTHSDLDYVRQELADAERELEQKETAPMEGRVVDEERYMDTLLALRQRVRELRDEERLLSEENE